jgi:hypothetical protein
MSSSLNPISEFDPDLEPAMRGVPSNTASIVEAHGGRSWAVGSPGRGATFYFSLPAANDWRQ